jgi:hypothetical protein
MIRAPAVMPCRWTWGESPTERSVRPSGEIKAVERGRMIPKAMSALVPRLAVGYTKRDSVR